MGLPQLTTDGRIVEVVSVGQHNTDSGPDFFGAVIRIDGMTWTGNVEIHVKSSDWYLHKHQTDAAYDNIILHVVKHADREVVNSRGDQIVQCELQYPENAEILGDMMQDRSSVCSQKLFDHPNYIRNEWKQQLLEDRMQKKVGVIEQLLKLNKNNWEEAFYITLAHNFGFHTNGVPFEMLAKQTPISYLNKHRNSLFQIEAMLFGQAGLLDRTMIEDVSYAERLKKEYAFLQKKFGLEPIDGSLWKMARMRPKSFPQVRIRQFAQLIHEKDGLFAQLMDEQDVKKIREILHTGMGKSSIDILIINSVVPYKYAWGKAHHSMRTMEDAMRLLQEIPAEKNHIIEQWQMLGMEIRNAADSQTYLHLYQDYCIRNKCYNCDIGYQIFTIKNA